MVRLINLLRGRVTVEVTGAWPERLINLCAANGVAFWGVEWVDAATFRFTVALWDWKKVKELAGRAMCELSAPRFAGVPAAVRRLRRRYGFWVGLGVFLLTLAVLPGFILVVEVEGNLTVPDSVILTELRRLGVKPLAYAPRVDEKAVANEALIALDDLSFLAINLYGCRAEVTVREAEKAPSLLEQQVPADIVAIASGIVIDVKAAAGQPLVERGDTVVEGDVLITGFMDLPEYTYSEEDMGNYTVHAVGQVTARTWRTLRTVIPLTAALKDYTGEHTTRYALNFPGGRLNFYQNSGISYDRYDKIVSITRVALPGGGSLPFSLTKETVREYTLVWGELDSDAAVALLEAGLRRELDDILQETDGEVVRLDYTARVEGTMLTVTMLAECVEQIGVTVEREGQVGFTPGTGGKTPAGNQ